MGISGDRLYTRNDEGLGRKLVRHEDANSREAMANSTA